MPLEELLSMYGYGLDECAPDDVNTEVDSKIGQEVSVNAGDNSDSSHHSSKTRSKLKYLRENHISDSSKFHNGGKLGTY